MDLPVINQKRMHSFFIPNYHNIPSRKSSTYESVEQASFPIKPQQRWKRMVPEKLDSSKI